MPRVICELPNASLEINGVPFEKMEDGRIRSAEVEQEIADFFLSIPGYLADGVVAPVIDKTTVASTGPKSTGKAGKPAKTAAAPAVDPAIAIAAAAAEAAAAAAEEEAIRAAEAEAEEAAALAAAAAEAEAAAAAGGESGNSGATGDTPPADDVF